jgi:hypothetical protein
MFARLLRIADELEETVAGLDPALLGQADAVRGLDLFARLVRLAEAGRTLCGGRAVATNAHHGSGSRSGADWLARRTGQSVGQAIDALDTAAALPALPALSEALRQGRLSSPQAAAVAAGAAADPSAEDTLLSAAASEPLSQLKEKSRRVVADASSEEEQIAAEERLHKQRYLRTFPTRGGAVRGEFSLSPLDGARFLAAIETEQRFFFEQGRRRGEFERSEAYAADALVALCERKAEPGRVPVNVTLTVEAEALRRGHTTGGETCEIAGVGPVPVATARSVLGESWLRLVVRRGVDVLNVCHAGRYVSDHLRTSLLVRDGGCVVPGCGSTRLLEFDHWRVPFKDCGQTELSNLATLCRHHHRLKTHHGWRLVGGVARWRWLKPGDSEEDPPAPAEGHTRVESTPIVDPPRLLELCPV